MFRSPVIKSTVVAFQSFETYIEDNNKATEQNIHGDFQSIVTGGTVDPVPTSITISSQGLGKIFIDVGTLNVAGTITLTGTSVDRNTGATTGGATETIAIDTVTTDNSGTDAFGNTTHAFSNGYISSTWYDTKLEDLVITGDGTVDIDNVGIWHISFEQFGDQQNTALRAIDISLELSAATNPIIAHLYGVRLDPLTKKCEIIDVISDEGDPDIAIATASATSGKRYRLRRGNFGLHAGFGVDGRHDGFWVDLFLATNAIEDLSMKVWYSRAEPVEVA